MAVAIVRGQRGVLISKAAFLPSAKLGAKATLRGRSAVRDLDPLEAQPSVLLRRGWALRSCEDGHLLASEAAKRDCMWILLQREASFDSSLISLFVLQTLYCKLCYAGLAVPGRSSTARTRRCRETVVGRAKVHAKVSQIVCWTPSSMDGQA